MDVPQNFHFFIEGLEVDITEFIIKVHQEELDIMHYIIVLPDEPEVSNISVLSDYYEFDTLMAFQLGLPEGVVIKIKEMPIVEYEQINPSGTNPWSIFEAVNCIKE